MSTLPRAWITLGFAIISWLAILSCVALIAWIFTAGATQIFWAFLATVSILIILITLAVRS